MRVLIIDDDPDQLALRCLLLRRSGIEAIGAGEAQAAVQIATADKPDCAIVDLHLPAAADGLRLIRDLKQLHSAMRIVVLTGASSNHLAQAPERELIDQVLVKGTASAHLIQTLKSF
ncbi:MAG TPA: response regulator [Bryobacteraceae bacterium]|nr:response regulator [Bryobacteraceae bacterium]